jgi:hypothetical protein
MKRRTKHAKRRPLRSDERGAVMLMGLFMAVFMSGFMFLVASFGQAVAHREARQDRADSAALSSAIVYAQSMNLAASYNRVIRVNLEAAVTLRLVIDRCESDDGHCDSGDVTEYRRDYNAAIGRVRAAANGVQNLRRDTPGRVDTAVAAVAGGASMHGGAFAVRGRDYPTLPVDSLLDDELIDASRRYFNDHKEELVGSGAFLVPIEGFPLSIISEGANFGPRERPCPTCSAYHQGIDFGAPQGTEILAAQGGEIVDIGYNDAAGNYIVIDHGNGYRTRYLHMREGSPFAAGSHRGARVEQGQVIGYVGTTGRSTGPHLHFEIHEHGVPIDPMPLLGEGGVPEDATAADATAAHGRVLGDVGVAGFRGPYRVHQRDHDIPEFHESLVVRGFSVLDHSGLVAATDTTAFISALSPGSNTDPMSSLRPLGTSAFAEADIYSSTEDVPARNALITSNWHARLVRFRYPGPSANIGGECTRRSIPGCAAIDSTAGRLSRAVTQ